MGRGVPVASICAIGAGSAGAFRAVGVLCALGAVGVLGAFRAVPPPYTLPAFFYMLEIIMPPASIWPGVQVAAPPGNNPQQWEAAAAAAV